MLEKRDQGGCEALRIDYDAEVDKIIHADHLAADPDYHLVPAANDISLAETLLGRLYLYGNRQDEIGEGSGTVQRPERDTPSAHPAPLASEMRLPSRVHGRPAD